MSRRRYRKETTVYKDFLGRKKVITEWKPAPTLFGTVITIIVILALLHSC